LAGSPAKKVSLIAIASAILACAILGTVLYVQRSRRMPSTATVKEMSVSESAWWDGLASWLETDLVGPGQAPFCFVYDGRASQGLLAAWRYSENVRELDGKRTLKNMTWVDPSTRLEVRCEATTFKDYPAVEWVVGFRNGGSSDTPIIRDVQALDCTLTKGSGDFTLHRGLGSSAKANDFSPVSQVLAPRTQTSISPQWGRSSDTNSLPFFNVEWPNKGVMIYIGWSGQWLAGFYRDGGPSLEVRAGMELTHLKLHPGEEVRTPRMLVLFWKDSRPHGHNLMRRLILEHYYPRTQGEPVQPPVAYSVHGVIPFNDVTEANVIEFAKAVERLGVGQECIWIDTGWFQGGWTDGVGNWFPDGQRFPKGLRAVADEVHRMGSKFLVWFEPERVHETSWLAREHPEWILRLGGPSVGQWERTNGLLNLGNESARRWLTDHISQIIEECGIDIYRHDFNLVPLPFWRAADAPDRQGITEIRHIEGFYAFWDELLSRHPDLIIDNCASGGRRIDLETVMRSVPLWRTDFAGGATEDVEALRAQAIGLCLWLPARSAGATLAASLKNGAVDTYGFRSTMATGIDIAWPPAALTDAILERAREAIAELKRLREFLDGDFYLLTPDGLGKDRWTVVQFHREDVGEGVVLAFRPGEAPERRRLRLNGASRGSQYEVAFEDAGGKLLLNGDSLISGFEVDIASCPGSQLISYRRVS